MKKYIYIILVIVFIIVIIPKEKDDFRIRVISNSDTMYDQSIKMEVVKIVKDTINANDTKSDIKNKLPQLEKKINSFLGKMNISYKIEIRKEHFPEKSLNGKIIASGYYDSLVVEIGEANGKNWWTLLYPEYFNVTYDDIKSGEVETRIYIVDKFKELFND